MMLAFARGSREKRCLFFVVELARKRIHAEAGARFKHVFVRSPGAIAGEQRRELIDIPARFAVAVFKHANDFVVLAT